MSLLKIEWSFRGDFDSFDLLKSSSPMDVNNLPSPFATGLTTMTYLDYVIIDESAYYYRVVAWRKGLFTVSDELRAVAIPDDMTAPYDLYVIIDSGNFSKPINLNARSLL